MTGAAPTAGALRERFDANEPFTVGLEEEVLLVGQTDPHPASVAGEVVARVGRPGRVKLELPPCQVELVTAPLGSVEQAITELERLRVGLSHACQGLVRPAAAAVHPLAAGFDPSDLDGRYAAMVEQFGPATASSLLVGSLQIHVALGDERVVLPVHDLLREHLPVLAALGAAAPFHDGRDTGMASVRPLVSGHLPRHGIPPVLRSWERYAAELGWGISSGTVADLRQWWWELRPHPVLGTLEVRVLDVQPTVAAARSLVAVTVGLVRRLTEQVRSGTAPAPAPTWRIEENRWSALRHGMEGTMVDVRSGEVRPTRSVAARLLAEVEPWAEPAALGAHALVERNAADALREVGIGGAVDWLCSVFETSVHRPGTPDALSVPSAS